MYTIKQSTAITVPFFVHDVNGDAVTGLADGTFTKRISKNGAAFGAMTVTISEMENGWYSIPLSASHSDTTGLLTVTFTNGSSKQVNLQWRVEANLADDVATLVTTVDTVVDAILVDTAEIGAAGAGLTAINLPNQTMDITGDLSGSVGSVTGSVGSVVGHTAQTGDTFALANGASGFVATKAETALIVADTNELQTDDVPTLISTLDAVVDTVKAETALIVADTNELQTDDVPTLIATAQADLDTITGATGVNLLAATQASIDAIEVDTGTTLQAELDGIQADTEDLQTQMGTAGAGLTAVPWNASWDAEVESEVNDALDTAISELGVAAPTATPTIRTGLMLLYMLTRNKLVVQTSGVDAIEVYNNAGTKIAAKAVTDDGSDYTEAEMA